ncbi:nitrogen regulatory protein P-II [Methylocaldum marinum]|uniref:Nitrogen regulatory protein P-II n=1 Tax=Methylocaldum marinum TaxID=1432792 RepID=A0A250L2L2_9GAMM|nr:P-II family nitrogen regulator [Methylocaldum marinum]BBA36779.1 nitrogen regulatory protein P-II [Methylocaldum marinum]
MRFKLIIVFVEDEKTDLILKTARAHGATGATIIANARGEGLKREKTFFGMSLESQRDVLLFLVEEHLTRHILEAIARAGEFDERPGTGIALQVDVEDAVGITHQVETLTRIVEEEL